ncbi:MAG: PAS domain S-box protein [Candidatus Lokiarchaeota archaeon]
MVKSQESFFDFGTNQIGRLIIENLDNLVCFLNNDLEIIYVNNYFKKVLDYNRERILGNSILKIIDSDNKEEFKEFLQNLFTDNEFEIDLKLITKKGRSKWCQIKGIKLEDNKLPQDLILIIGRELQKKRLDILKEKEDNLQEFYNSLTEIRFWKLFQSKDFKNAIEASQEMLSLVINNIPQYIAWKDRNLIYLGCNENYSHLCGLEAPKEIIGKTDVELNWGDEFAIGLMQKQNDIIKSGKSEFHLLETWKLNDKNVLFEINQIVLHDENNNVVGILTTYEDKTIQIKANNRIKESEQRFRDLTELLPDIIYESNTNLNITYLNKAGFEISGYTPKDLEKGLNIKQLINDSDKERVSQNIKDLLTGKKTTPNYYMFKKKNGGTFYGLAHSRSIYRNGKISGMRGVVHDLTDRKIAEEKYKHLFENAPYAIWLVNSQGIIIDCNKTMDDIFLSIYTREDLIGKNYLDVLKLFEKPEHFIPIFKKRFEKMMAGEKLDPIEFSIARAEKKAEEKIKESEEKLKKLNKELENKVFERTKELRKSEKILKKQNIQLKQLDNIKNEFITNAAHELKTPLISISGYTDYILLKYRKIISPEIKKDLNVVKRNVSRLERLMNQLLEVMKIDEEKLKINKEPVKVAELVRECIQELSYHLLAKNHDLVLEIEEDLIINADPEKIFQLFTNLLSNAIKFTPTNGRIEIKVESKGNFYQFAIIDNGIGLTKKEIDRLFKKFEIVKSPIMEFNDRITGTGLGLYISKGIVESHGGRIWAESEGSDKGTIFNFTLPK